MGMATDARGDVAQIAVVLARDFDGTCLLLANELATSSDPALVLEIVCGIASSEPAREDASDGEDEDESGHEEEPWRLSDDLLERFLTEFVPQAVQLVLATQTYAPACAPRVNRFLQTVLAQAKAKLLTGDPCLLPSLLRILDEQRPFYCSSTSSSMAADTVSDKDATSAFVQAPAPHVSPWFVANVAFWGDIGGFALFLSSLRSLVRDADGHCIDTVLSFEATQCIVRTLYGVAEHLAPQFLAAYVRPFCDALQCFVTTVAAAEFHAVPREALVEVAQVMELVLVKVLEPPTVGNHTAVLDDAVDADELRQSVQLLQLAIFRRQLQSPSLEKRICGLSDIVALVTRELNAQVEVQAQPTAASLMRKLAHVVAWLEQSDVLDDVFGEQRHAELIKRALPLFQFASELECLDADWLSRVWTCYYGSSGSHQRHEAHRAVAHDLLLDLIHCLDAPLLRVLLGKLQDISAVDASDLALLTAIAARSASVSDDAGDLGDSSETREGLRDVVLTHLWTVAIPRAESDAAIDDVLDHMEMITKRAVRESNDDDAGHTSGIALGFLQAALDVIASGAPTRVSLTAFTRLAFLVAELQWRVPVLTTHEHSSVIDVLLAALLDLPTSGVPVNRTDALHSRLLALRAAWILETHSRDVASADSALSRAQLDAIWQRLVDDPDAEDDASLCFAWLACCMNTSVERMSDGGDEAISLPLLSDDLLEHLVAHKFASLPAARMTPAALTCFQGLFQHLNLQREGLALTLTAPQQQSDDSNTEREAPDRSGRRSCLATGKPLVGVTQLWRLAVTAPAADVAEDCITFLASLYLEFTPDAARETDDVLVQKKLEFVDTCMRLLEDAKAASVLAPTQSAADHAPVESIATVNRCIDLLRYFLDACDAAAAIDTESESPRHLSDALSNSGAIPRGRKGWELEHLEERLPHLEIYPSPMKEVHVVATGPAASESGPLRRPSWTFRQHHAMLDAIPDDDESSDENDEPGRAADASRIWTHERSSRVSVAIDHSLPLPARAVITSPTLRVRPTLLWPQDVSPPRGPDLSTEDLSQALHDASTELPPPSADHSAETAGRSSSPRRPPPTSKYSVASHVLANRGAYFDTLFQLVDWPDATSQRTWELLCRLPTNNALLRKMIRLRPPAHVSDVVRDVVWTDQLETTNTHRLLYALRLVEALLLPLDASDTLESDSTADAARRQWRERFVRLGGAHHLYETLLSWSTDHPTEADASASVYATNLRATCLAALVRTLTYVLRMPQRRPRADSYAVACAFDTRLFDSTLRTFVETIDLTAVRDQAMRLSMAYASESGRGVLSSQVEEAIQCSVQLFAAVGALDSRILTSAPTRSAKSRCHVTLADWLNALLLTCPSVAARTATLSTLADLLAKALPRSASAGAFIERLVCDLSALASAAPTASSDCSQLFALLERVLRESVPRLERLKRDAIVSWLDAHAVVPHLLMQLHELATRSVSENSSPATDVNERGVSSFMRVLQSLVGLADVFREQALRFQPRGNGDDDALQAQDQGQSAIGATTQWTLDLILTHLLFGDAQASGDGATAPAANLPACTSDDSRALAHALLVSLLTPSSEPSAAANSVDSIHAAMNYVLTHHAAFQASVLETLSQRGRPWRFVPRELLRDSARESTHAGLVNPGCVCYMNALLQQLYLTPRFRDGLLATDCSDSSVEWADEVAQLQQLFAALAFSTRKALDPTAFALSHRDLDGEPTDVRVQMDADEFFCLLLDRLDTSLRSSRSRELQDARASVPDAPKATFLDNCFGGVLVHQVTTEYGDVSERDEKFFALSLDVSSQPTLTDSLAQYVQGEALDGANAYYCERLERKVAATKRVCVKTLPQTLVCHLKRFAFDFDTMEKRKVHDALAFPHELDLLPFTRDGLSGAADATDSIMYDLVGVVVHSGSADMGHYYSFIKDREARSSSAWLEFNDEAVRAFDIEDLGSECFGGEEVKQLWDGHARISHVQMKRRSAYMLVYERRVDALAGSTNKASSATVASVHPTLSALVAKTQLENAQFQRVVDTFSPTYSAFAETLVAQTLALPPSQAASPSAVPDQSRGWTNRVQAVVLGCQYLFGMASLQAFAPDDTAATSSFAAHQTALLARILNWVSATSAADDDPETISSTDDDDADRCAFSAWLLREAVASSSPASASAARSWVFDLVFLNEHNPELVDGCLAILEVSVSVLSRHAASMDNDDASTSRAVLHDFYRTLLDLFYDREHARLEILDPTTSGAVSLSSHATMSALARIGAFLERCVCIMFADAPEARTMTLTILAHSLQFVDRLLFTLQTELTDVPGPYASTTLRPSGGEPRVRTCTLEVERRILTELLPLVCSDGVSANSHHRSRHCGMAVDVSLLLSQTALTNVVWCGLDQELAPVLVRIAQRGSAMQREKLLSLLMAVLEDLKATHVQPILRLIEQLLDAEERDVAGLDASQAVASARSHSHIFSASRELLEAAAYYRDHETLQSYTCALLRFCVMRGRTSRLLQCVFGSSDGGGDALRDQVAWVPDWLANYVDPSGDIRRQRSTGAVATAMEGRSEEDAAHVEDVLDALAVMFQCAVVPDSAPCEEHEMKQHESGELTLDDVVAEIVESHGLKQRKELQASAVVKELGPEVDDTDEDGDDDELNNSHTAASRDKDVARTRPPAHASHRVEAAALGMSMRDRMFYNRSEA